MWCFWFTGRWGLPAARPAVCRAAVGAALGLLAGCAPPEEGVHAGYVEGEYVCVAAPLAGRLTRLEVTRGVEVAGGQALFALESEVEMAAVQEAESRLAEADHRLADLRKGRRPSELAVLEARVQETAARLALAETELRRQEQLRDNQVIAPAELDVAVAQRDADVALLASLRAELDTARLGAREDAIQAAEAERESRVAALARARWALDQKQQTAPVAARVHETLYRPGEYVAAGMPVVALLPPANVKVRFFVPEPELGRVKIGAKVAVTLSGEPTPVEATIRYVSTQPEFTPPVIYSRENRAKLVFMVEAHPSVEVAPRWHPGQPAEVRWAP